MQANRHAFAASHKYTGNLHMIHSWKYNKIQMVKDKCGYMIKLTAAQERRQQYEPENYHT